MVGIISHGAHIPLWRLSREAIGKAWETRSAPGERAVANNDEDTVTMAVEAVISCLGNRDRQQIDALYFASTSPPFKEKECATLVAAAADLRSDIATADFGGSLRAGTAALRAALDAVKAGSSRNVMVVAAEQRLGYPRSEYEQSLGDAAAAFLVADVPVSPATVEARFSLANEMYDVWRLDKATYVQSWEDRFVVDHGYSENTEKAINGLLKQTGLAPRDISKVALYGPSTRAQMGLARKVGFEPTQVQDLLIDSIGNSGCAHSLLLLAAALEEAGPGDRILLASYGSGADAFLIKVSQRIDKVKEGFVGVKALIKSKQPLSYIRYLSYRGIIETQPGEPFRLFPSASASWRERPWAIRMHASRCRKCGRMQFPIAHICYECGSKDNYDEVRLSDKLAKVYTYTLDQLAGRSDDPMVPQTTLEFDVGNVRTYLTMTDFNPAEIKIGMPVEMTFRRMYEGAGMYHYFWKCRPVRRQEWKA